MECEVCGVLCVGGVCRVWGFCVCVECEVCGVWGVRCVWCKECEVCV